MDASHFEFQRQLRSLFAVLRALIRRTADARESVPDYVAHLEGRIAALARVHEMLMRAPAEGVDLEEILHGELLWQAIPEERYRLRGPQMRLARESAGTLALALHELTVNALTHGAFAAPAGKLEVEWTETRDGTASWLEVIWRERGTRPGHTSPPRKGFGWELIERTLPYELNAKTSLAFTREGICVELRIPARAETIVWQREDAANESIGNQHNATDRS